MRRVRSRAVAGAVAGAVLTTALVLAAAGFLSRDNGSDPAPGAATDASPSATPVGAEGPAPTGAGSSDEAAADDGAVAAPMTAALQRKQARVTVASFTAKVSRLVSGGPKRISAAAGIGTATFVDELRATADFNHDSGISVQGEPRIVDMRVSALRLGASPQTAVVVVCLDNSDVRVVDDAGNVVQEQAHSRTRQRFLLVRPADRWLIDSQDFPANPNCT